MDFSNSRHQGPVEEYVRHNEQLTKRPDWKQIWADVCRTADYRFASEQIEREERLLASEETSLTQMEVRQESSDTPLTDLERGRLKKYRSELRKRRELLERNKQQLEKDPQGVASSYYSMGSCHEIWAKKKAILKEKYGLTWYSPSEVNPYTMYD